SMAPHQIRGARWGLPLGEQKLEDYLWVALVDSYNGLGMANTAENLGRKYGIKRDAADEFAHRSHKLAAKAREDCRFSKEIVPVTVKTKHGEVVVDKDEHIRADTTVEVLPKLSARFAEGGTVAAGSAAALGHPLGASGARLALTLADELRERGGKRGLASLCIGGGQGIAAIIERVN